MKRYIAFQGIIWVGLVLIGMVISCAKKTDSTIYLPAKIKSNFSFKPGSYWIYRDSISGLEDSITAFENRIILVNDVRSLPYVPYELMLISMQHNAKRNEEKFWLSLHFSTGKLEGEYGKYKNDTDQLGTNNLSCHYTITPKGAIEWSDDNFSPLYPIDLNLGSNHFNNVIKTTYSSSTEYTGYSQLVNNTVFINDSLGYIKIDLNICEIKNHDTTYVRKVWELQRWHVLNNYFLKTMNTVDVFYVTILQLMAWQVVFIPQN